MSTITITDKSAAAYRARVVASKAAKAASDAAMVESIDAGFMALDAMRASVVAFVRTYTFELALGASVGVFAAICFIDKLV